MPVLSAADIDFWEENGYVVLHDAVPPENCKAAERAIWDFLEMDTDDPETWYPNPPRRGIMVEIYQHQALWDNRQYPRIHQAFSEIWDTEKLWVSFDRGSLNPPERADFKFPGPHLHWDMSLDGPVDGLKVQGVLYLTDTPANQGAFTCIPGFHHKLGIGSTIFLRMQIHGGLSSREMPMPCRLRAKRGIWLSGTVPCRTGAVRTAAIVLA